MLTVGRICVKTAGREAGKQCVVIRKDKEEGFVFITGPKAATGVRRRRCNVEHLEPLEDTIDIKADATDEEILKIYEKLKLLEKFGVEKRTPFKKPSKEAKKEKAEAVKEPKTKTTEKPKEAPKQKPKEAKPAKAKPEVKKEAKK